jgi:hypothetical protein
MPIMLDESEPWSIVSKQTVVLGPRAKLVILGKVVSDNVRHSPTPVCVEPALIPIQGICVARVLTYTESTSGEPHRQEVKSFSRIPEFETRKVLSGFGTNHVKSQAEKAVKGQPCDTVVLKVVNFSEEPLTVQKGTVLGVAQEISENVVVPIDEQGTVKSSDQVLFSGPGQRVTRKVKEYIGTKLAHLSGADRSIIEPVLLKYADIFHHDEDNDFKSTVVIEHRIETGIAAPIKKPQYPIPFALREEVDRQVKVMLEKGVIRPSSSTWQSPVILVPKKSESESPKYRFCVDYRGLNAVTKFDSYPLPRFEDTVSTLAGSKWFSKLDLNHGFWQINIREQDKEKSAFSVPSGFYEFNRMPFGMANSPASFQRLMDVLLRDLTGSECWVFLDDVVTYSDTLEEHARQLAHVFERIKRANLQLRPWKCDFAKSKILYLGYILSQEGTEASEDKIKAIQLYPTPKSVKDLRAFLGLSSFYRRFVPHFADIAKLLTQLTRKDQTWQWTQECQKAFEELKGKLSYPPVLAFPDLSKPFILATDASQVGLGAVLSQVQEGMERPVAYASRQLNKAERSYSASELEALAVVWATKYFRCYLYGKKFLVRTDHAALKFMHKFADNNARLMRWSLRLSEFYFEVEHVPGTKMGHVDALNRQ